MNFIEAIKLATTMHNVRRPWAVPEYHVFCHGRDVLVFAYNWPATSPNVVEFRPTAADILADDWYVVRYAKLNGETSMNNATNKNTEPEDIMDDLHGDWDVVTY